MALITSHNYNVLTPIKRYGHRRDMIINLPVPRTFEDVTNYTVSTVLPSQVLYLPSAYNSMGNDHACAVVFPLHLADGCTDRALDPTVSLKSPPKP